MDSDTRDFLAVLGVTVLEVDDLNRDCARWSERTKTLMLCERLCAARREKFVHDLLARI